MKYTTLFVLLSLASFVFAQTCDPAASQFSNCNDITISNFRADGVNADSADFSGSTIRSSVFIRSTLNQASFQSSSLSSVTFSDCVARSLNFNSLSTLSCNFRESLLDSSVLDDATFVGSFFVDVSCKDCSLINTKIEGSSELTNVDFDGSEMTRLELTSITMNGGNLANTVMFTAVLTLSTFVNVNQDSSTLDNSFFISSSHSEWSANALSSRTVSYNGHVFRNSVVTDSNFVRSTFQNAVANGFNVSESNLNQARWINFSLVNSSWNSISLNQIDANDVRISSFVCTDCSSTVGSYGEMSIESSTFVSLDLQAAEMTDVTFTECDFNSGTTLQLIDSQNVRFVRCTFGNAVSFVNSDANSVGFVDSDFTSASAVDFHDSVLQSSDFSGALLPENAAAFYAMNMDNSRMWGINAPGIDFRGLRATGISFRQRPTGPNEATSSVLDGANFGAFSGTPSRLDFAEFNAASLRDVNFVGANLTGADFRFAQVNGADFSNAILINADFSAARGLGQSCNAFCASRGCLCNSIPLCANGEQPTANGDCSDSTLSDYVYIGEDFSGTDFTNTVFDSILLDSCLLVNTAFVSTSVSGNPIGIVDSNAAGADFSSAQFVSYYMNSTACSNCTFDNAVFRGSSGFVNVNFDGGSMRSVTARGPFVLRGCVLNDADLFRLRIAGNDASIRIDAVSARGSSFVETALQGAVFNEGQFDSADFTNSILSLSQFSGVSFTNTDFRGALLDRVQMNAATFEASELQEIDFQGSDIRGTSFENSNLTSAAFRFATLNNVNFNFATLVNVDLRNATLSGTTRFVGADCTDIRGVGGCVSFCATRRCICNIPTEVPTPTPTPTLPLASPTPDGSALPSPTPTPSVTPPPTEVPTPTGSPTPTREPSPTPTPRPGVCFPSSAQVELEGGAHVAMSELQIGDRVRVHSAGERLTTEHSYSPVILFTHQQHDVTAEFVRVEFQERDVEALVASPLHYVYVLTEGAESLKRMEHVGAGDVLLHADGRALVASKVTQNVKMRGLFNPQTMSGAIFVQNIKASCYTATVPPMLAHVLLAPIRLSFKIFSSNLIGSYFHAGGSDRIHQILAPFRSLMN
mmetsp:Transcript_2610/g.4591  ORF Transcript_2610/g.4591 Transcript_2610/m.4591 type:complete len:1095 (-) Transcript_2610:80-3364(-)